MKRRTKSILSVLFALAMLMNFVPVSAFATTTDTTPTVAPTAAATDAAATPAATSWKAFMMYSAAEKPWEIYEDAGCNSTDFIGDGVYTVAVKASDLGATAAPTTPQVFLVDIPGFAKVMEDAGLNINNYTDSGDGTPHDIAKHFQPTDLTLKVYAFVDGKKIMCKNDKINYGDIEEKGTFRIELYNQWGLHNACIKDDPPVNTLAICPADEIKVVFEISGTGVNTDAGAKAIADYEASLVTPTVAAADTSSTSSDTDATTTSADSSDSAPNYTPIIIAAVAVVVVVVIVIIVVASKKKK